MVFDGYMGVHFIILFCICLEFSIMKLFLKKKEAEERMDGRRDRDSKYM